MTWVCVTMSCCVFVCVWLCHAVCVWLSCCGCGCMTMSHGVCVWCVCGCVTMSHCVCMCGCSDSGWTLVSLTIGNDTFITLLWVFNTLLCDVSVTGILFLMMTFWTTRSLSIFFLYRWEPGSQSVSAFLCVCITVCVCVCAVSFLTLLQSLENCTNVTSPSNQLKPDIAYFAMHRGCSHVRLHFACKGLMVAYVQMVNDFERGEGGWVSVTAVYHWKGYGWLAYVVQTVNDLERY